MRPACKYQLSARTSVSVRTLPRPIDSGSACTATTLSVSNSGGSGMRTWSRYSSCAANRSPKSSEMRPEACTSSWAREKLRRGRLRWNRNDGLGSAQLAAGARAHQGLDGELAQVQKAALQLRLRLEVLAVDGSHCAVHSRLLKGEVRSAIAEL
jgi:hypothetical protein